MTRISGLKAKHNGERFEQLIDRACFMYQLRGEAYVVKTPEPMRPIKSLKNGQFVAVYTKAAQPDYKGTLVGGRAVCFEAKHTELERIEQKRVTEEQAKALDIHMKLGAVCFVFVSVQFKDFYRVPWAVWRDMKKYCGKVSMNMADLEPYRVKAMYFLDNLKGCEDD